jgi:acetolactate synthase-1/2/3 large subunit
MVKYSQSMALDPEAMSAQRSLPPGRNLNTDLGEIRFDEVARAMGAVGERVSRARDLRPALEACLASGRPAVIHVDVDPVSHMWAPGLDVFKKMHLEPGDA